MYAPQPPAYKPIISLGIHINIFKIDRSLIRSNSFNLFHFLLSVFRLGKNTFRVSSFQCPPKQIQSLLFGLNVIRKKIGDVKWLDPPLAPRLNLSRPPTVKMEKRRKESKPKLDHRTTKPFLLLLL